jgi:hypothetical protein
MENKYLELEYPLAENLQDKGKFHIFDIEDNSLCEKMVIYSRRRKRKFYIPDELLTNSDVCKVCEKKLNHIKKNISTIEKLNHIFKDHTDEEKSESILQYLNNLKL